MGNHYNDKHQIKDLLNSDVIKHLRHLLPNGKVKDNSFYTGNINGDTGESLVITLSGKYAGKGKDFATGESVDLFDLFAYHWNLQGNANFRTLIGRLKEYLGLAPESNKTRSHAEITAIKERQKEAVKQRQIKAEQEACAEADKIRKKQETALKIWDKATAIKDTQAHLYLRSRSLNPSYGKNTRSIGYSECYHSELKQSLPCLIALIKDTNTNTPLGVERHYLPPEPQETKEAYKQWFKGQNISRRKALGISKGGAVMLNYPNKSLKTLVLCEGVINALTAMDYIKDKTCPLEDATNPLNAMFWAFLSAGNIRNITIPDHIKYIILFCDNDTSGQATIQALKDGTSYINLQKSREKQGGNAIELKAFKVTKGNDLNDLILTVSNKCKINKIDIADQKYLIPIDTQQNKETPPQAAT